VPALHRAVLDEEADAALGRVLDERGQLPLGQFQVLGHRQVDVPADEGADAGDTEGGRGVDAVAQVPVDAFAFPLVAVEVVVAVRHRREGESVLGHQVPYACGVGVREVGDVEVCGLVEVAAGRRAPTSRAS
jgi:hypothetical protein